MKKAIFEVEERNGIDTILQAYRNPEIPEELKATIEELFAKCNEVLKPWALSHPDEWSKIIASAIESGYKQQY